MPDVGVGEEDGRNGKGRSDARLLLEESHLPGELGGAVEEDGGPPLGGLYGERDGGTGARGIAAGGLAVRAGAAQVGDAPVLSSAEEMQKQEAAPRPGPS